MTSAEFKKKIDTLPIFADNHKNDVDHVTEKAPAPDESAKLFMVKLKNLMKLLTTRIVKINVTDEEFRSKKVKHEKGQKHKKNKKESKQKAGEERETKDISNRSHTVSKEGDGKGIEDSRKGIPDATTPKTSGPSTKVKNVLSLIRSERIKGKKLKIEVSM